MPNDKIFGRFSHMCESWLRGVLSETGYILSTNHNRELAGVVGRKSCGEGWGFLWMKRWEATVWGIDCEIWLWFAAWKCLNEVVPWIRACSIWILCCWLLGRCTHQVSSAMLARSHMVDHVAAVFTLLGWRMRSICPEMLCLVPPNMMESHACLFCSTVHTIC